MGVCVKLMRSKTLTTAVAARNIQGIYALEAANPLMSRAADQCFAMKILTSPVPQSSALQLQIRGNARYS